MHIGDWRCLVDNADGATCKDYRPPGEKSHFKFLYNVSILIMEVSDETSVYNLLVDHTCRRP